MFAATHRRLGLLAAIKRVRGGDLAEASVIARLDHPHVVRIYDAGLDDEGAWIAMERAAGVIGRSESRDGWVAALDAVLAGLAAAHAAGVVHGDIKPGNVLVRPDGTPVVSDFGLVATGSAGTPAYLSPEVFAGDPSSPQSDLYAVGCLGVTLCTGSPPFGRGDWAALAERHQRDPVQIEPRIPLSAGLVDWLHRLLAKDPAARFQHAADARQALREQARIRAVVVGVGSDNSLTLTRTRQTAGRSGSRRPVASEAQAPPVAALPLSWPRRAAPREPGQAGLGLLDLLEVPFAERPDLTEPLWGWLLEVERSREPLTVRLVGPPGAGKTRLGRAFALAAGEAGCAVPGVGGDRVRVRWLDESPPEPVRGPVLQLTTAPVPADHTLTLPPFQADLCRRVLSRWVHLRRDLVTDLADRCAGDLGLAVATITEAVEAGILVPGPTGLEATRTIPLAPAVVARYRAALEPLPEALREPLHAATVLGHTVALDRLSALVHDARPLADWLIAHHLARATDDGFAWVSAAARQAARPEDDRAWHARAADQVEGDDWRACWRRGVHRLWSGDAMAAHDDLLDAGRDMIGTGKMVQAERVLRRLHADLEAHPDVTDSHRLDALHVLGQLGPTHLGVGPCLALRDRAIALVEAHGDDPDWTRRGSSIYGSTAWLLNVLRLPKRCAAVLERAAAIEGDAPHPATLSEVGYLRMFQGRPEEADAVLVRSVERALETDQLYSELVARAVRLESLRLLGRPGLPAHLVEVRQRWWDAGYHSADGDLLRALGDIHRQVEHDADAAVEAYKGAIAAAAQGEARADPSFELGLAQGLLAQGQLDAAHARVLAALPDLEEMGPTWTALAAVVRLTIEAVRGDPPDAPALRAAIEAFHQTGYHDPDLPHYGRRILAVSLDDDLLAAARGLLDFWPGTP